MRIKPGTLEKQQVLLTTEPSTALISAFFFFLRQSYWIFEPISSQGVAQPLVLTSNPKQ